MNFIVTSFCALVFLGSEVECQSNLTTVSSETVLKIYGWMGYNDTSVENLQQRYASEAAGVVELIKSLLEAMCTEYLKCNPEKKHSPPPPIVMIIPIADKTGKYIYALWELAKTIEQADLTLYYIAPPSNAELTPSEEAWLLVLYSLPPSVKVLRYIEKPNGAEQKKIDLKVANTGQGEDPATIAYGISQEILNAGQDDDSKLNSNLTVLEHTSEKNANAVNGSAESVTELYEGDLESASIIVEALHRSKHSMGDTTENCLMQLEKISEKESKTIISDAAPSRAGEVGGWVMLNKFGRAVLIHTAWFQPDLDRNYNEFIHILLSVKGAHSKGAVSAHSEKDTFLAKFAYMVANEEFEVNEKTKEVIIEALEEERVNKFIAFVEGQIERFKNLISRLLP